MLLQPLPGLRAAPNVNALWAQALVEELCRHGINTFAVAPGGPLSLTSSPLGSDINCAQQSLQMSSNVLLSQPCVCRKAAIQARLIEHGGCHCTINVDHMLF